MTALISAEWIKIRSVRSTIWSVVLTVALSVGLAYLVGLSFRANFAHLPPDQQAGFDPLFATFYSLTIGQLPLVVLAVFVVTSEYSTATIRTSLTVVPQRGAFYAAKVLTGALLAAAVAAMTVIATFAAAQAGLGPHGTSLNADGVPVAVAGACLYLTLIYLFATGLATLLRTAIPTLGILLPLLFLGSQGLGNVPKLKTVTQYLPDQAGQVIMHIVGQADDPRFARPYGPWTGIGLMALWTVTALLAGYVAMRRRDT
ncbi:ABC transporter permease [Micromonospora sp. NPDC126480]|uniref:ABC transporter permease n=1 Tax=Micromonospora sp. NPDC126480 TaxID=3155312 RepID=UPI00331D306A